MGDPILDKLAPQFQQQLDWLRSGAPLDGEAIHDFRVLCKQLRAYLQFYRGERSAEQIKTLDRQVKRLAKAFASSRDSDVIAQGLTALCADNLNWQQALAPLQAQLRETQHLATPNTGEIADQLQSLIDDWWASLACEQDSFLLSGSLNCYKRARQLARQAVASREDEAYHLWRKWAKYWLYQLRFGMAADNKPAKKYLGRLNKLGNRLGLFQDDCLMVSLLLEQRSKIDREVCDQLLAVLAERKKKAKHRFREDAEQLFSKPGKKLLATGILAVDD